MPIMIERARLLERGGQIGRFVGRAAMVGGASFALWGGWQLADALFIDRPDHNASATKSTTDPEYLQELAADSEQAWDGVDGILTGGTVALAGFAVDTFLYRRPEELAEQALIEQNPLLNEEG